MHVVDDLGDLQESNGGRYAVQSSHLLPQFIGKESFRRRLCLPVVKVHRLLSLLVKCEELEAKIRQSLEHLTSVLGHLDNPSAVQSVFAVEYNTDANHGASSLCAIRLRQ